MRITLHRAKSEIPHTVDEVCLVPQNDRDREICRQLAAGFRLVGCGRDCDGEFNHVRIALEREGER